MHIKFSCFIRYKTNQKKKILATGLQSKCRLKHNKVNSCKAWHHFLCLPCSWPRWCGRGSHPAAHTSLCCSSLGLQQPSPGVQGQPAGPRCVNNQHNRCQHDMMQHPLTGSMPLWMASSLDILPLKPGAKLFGLMATKHWPWEQQHNST